MSQETETLILVPAKEQVEELLRSVLTDGHTQQRLLPKLLTIAGEEKYPVGIIMHINLSLYDYCESMPPAMFAIMSLSVPGMIRAFVNNEDEYQETLTLWNRLK